MPKKILILILIIFINNCVSKKQSIGDFNEIVIVTSHVDKELVYPCKKVTSELNLPYDVVDFKNKMINLKNLGETSGVYVNFNKREELLILYSKHRVYSLNYNKKLPAIF